MLTRFTSADILKEANDYGELKEKAGFKRGYSKGYRAGRAYRMKLINKVLHGKGKRIPF